MASEVPSCIGHIQLRNTVQRYLLVDRKKLGAKMKMNRMILMLGFLSISSPAVPEWTGTTDTDPFTDKSVSVASSSYEDGAHTRSIVVKCDGDEFSTYVAFGEYLGDEMLDARYRVDKNDPVETSWRPSADGTAAFAYSALARGLVSGQSIVIEVSDYRGVAHRAKFDLTGSSAKVLPVMNVCNERIKPLAQGIEGLRNDFAQELERFSAIRVSLAKEMLSQRGDYDGPIDSDLDSEFALALQKSADAFVEACKSKNLSEDECGSVGILLSADLEFELETTVYAMSSGDVNLRLGKLSQFD